MTTFRRNSTGNFYGPTRRILQLPRHFQLHIPGSRLSNVSRELNQQKHIATGQETSREKRKYILIFRSATRPRHYRGYLSPLSAAEFYSFIKNVRVRIVGSYDQLGYDFLSGELLYIWNRLYNYTAMKNGSNDSSSLSANIEIPWFLLPAIVANAKIEIFCEFTTDLIKDVFHDLHFPVEIVRIICDYSMTKSPTIYVRQVGYPIDDNLRANIYHRTNRSLYNQFQTFRFPLDREITSYNRHKEKLFKILVFQICRN